MGAPRLNLTDLISAVRGELEELERDRILRGSPPLFQFEKLELELHFTVVGDTKGGTKFDLKILSLGSDVSIREEEVQTIKITLGLAADAVELSVPGARPHSSTKLSKDDDIIPLP